MKLIHSTIVSLFVIGVTCRQFHIPAVDEVVRDILGKDNAYIHFHGNHSDSSSLIERQTSSSYWYENIQHQGVSAFGPSGYRVYRNVRDYGATGTFMSYA